MFNCITNNDFIWQKIIIIIEDYLTKNVFNRM